MWLQVWSDTDIAPHLYLQEWDFPVFTMDLTRNSLGRILYTSMKMQLQQEKIGVCCFCYSSSRGAIRNRISTYYNFTRQHSPVAKRFRAQLDKTKGGERLLTGDARCISRALYLKGNARQYSHLETKTSFKDVSCFSQRKMKIQVTQYYQEKLLQMN